MRKQPEIFCLTLGMQLLLGANRVCTAARRQQRTLDANEVAAFRTFYDALVREGEAIRPETTQQPGPRGRGKQTGAANLLRRFRLHADAVLRFISNPAVPFTNNVGERAVCIIDSGHCWPVTSFT